jgi:hypothetical protein
MQHEKFRKVTMLAPVASPVGGLVLQTPAGTGDLVQFMPAVRADGMREAEEADAALEPALKQRIFYKNGIEKIGTKTYYAHDVVQADGQRVTEYRTDEPETKASAAAAAAAKAAEPSADVKALVGAIGGLVAGIQAGVSASQPEPAQNEAPNGNLDPAAQLPENTTAANIAAGESGQPVVNPVANANGTADAANADNGAGTDKTDKTDSAADKTDAQTDADKSKTDAGADSTAKMDAMGAAAAAGQSGKPGPKTAASKAAAAKADGDKK